MTTQTLRERMEGIKGIRRDRLIDRITKAISAVDIDNENLKKVHIIGNRYHEKREYPCGAFSEAVETVLNEVDFIKQCVSTELETLEDILENHEDKLLATLGYTFPEQPD